MFRLASFTDRERKERRRTREQEPVSGCPERLRGGEQRRQPRVAQRRPGGRARGQVSGGRTEGTAGAFSTPSARARPGPRAVPAGCERGSGSLAKEPSAAGCSRPGRAWLPQLRGAGEVLWGNRTGSISTMTTSALVSAVQKQNSKKWYHTKLYAAFVL